MPSLSFDPKRQSYMDYLNQMSGYRQEPYNSFPAETSVPYYSQTYQADSPQGPTQPVNQQKPPVNNALPAAIGVKGAADLADKASNWLTPASQAPAAASAPSTAVGGSALPAYEAGFGPTQLAAEQGAAAYELPTQIGIQAPTYAAPTYGGIANTGIGASIMPYAAPAAVGAIAAGTAKSAYEGWDKSQYKAGNAIEGAKTGFKNAPWWVKSNLVLAPAPIVAGALGAAFGSGKDEDQMRRDMVRKGAQESGWFGKNFEVPLDDITLDMGKDGGFKYTNAAGVDRNAYDVDWNDPNAEQGVGWLQPLAAVMAQGDEKLTSDFTGQFYNELTKDGKATDPAELRKRVVKLYNQFQLKPSMVMEAIEAMGFDEGKKAAFINGINSLKPGKGVNKATVKPSMSDGTDIKVGQKDPVKPVAEKPKMQPLGTGATAKPAPQRFLNNFQGGMGFRGR